MKILELTHFSEGACGVWVRAREEAIRLAEKGHEILILSSNAVKGKDNTAPKEERIKKIKIKRFPYKMIGGESFMYWNFKKEALKFSPDAIITHNYRQIHALEALKIANILRKKGKKCEVFLVTHAPFVEGNITRSFKDALAVKFYDFLIGPLTINKFTKILTISNWEKPYLIKMGTKENKIQYIPNGIPEEFFKQKKSPTEHKILFLGRISVKKKLDTLVKAMQYVKDKKIKLEIVGPQEKGYADYIISLVKKLYLQDRIKFSSPVYDVKKKIQKIDSAKLFVLPSRVEGMPQSLIEAMAREKTVIGSDSIAIRDLIKDKSNGYLFQFNNPKDLARKIDEALKENKAISKKAKESVNDFSWNIVIKQIEDVIQLKTDLKSIL
jgi:glycosyltransferase involved in cell wall biosynthesis